MKTSRHILATVVILGLALFSSISLQAQSGASLPTYTVGDTLTEISPQPRFLLDAEPGQTITLDWQGIAINDRCDIPVQGLMEVRTAITNAEGEPVPQIGLVYTPATPREVFRMVGSGPYQVFASICGGLERALTILDGDAIVRVDQPPLSLDSPVVFSGALTATDRLITYPLDVQAGDVFTIAMEVNNTELRRGNYAYFALVRDANGAVVSAKYSDQLPYTTNLYYPVYTADQPLPYRLDLPALGIYTQGNACASGGMDCLQLDLEVLRGNTVMEDGGTIAVGAALQNTIPTGKSVLYTVDVAENDPFTFRYQWSQQTPRLFFFNADFEQADAVTDAVNQASAYNWQMSLLGPPPYVLLIEEGVGDYALQMEDSATLQSNEVGRLAPGGVLRGTVPAVDAVFDYVTLDVNPNTIITLNWGVPQSEFTIRGANGPLYSINDHWSDGYAVVDLSKGTPPFVVMLDDARYAGQPFTFTLAEGDRPLAPG